MGQIKNIKLHIVTDIKVNAKIDAIKSSEFDNGQQENHLHRWC